MHWLVCPLNPAWNGAVDHRGNVQQFSRENIIKTGCLTHEAAIEQAQTMAKKNPGEQYAVFKVDSIWETGEPKIIQKCVNEAGEVVLAEKVS